MDLSTQVDTVAPLDGGVLVPAGSFPSNQRTQPGIFIGPVYTVRKIGIPISVADYQGAEDLYGCPAGKDA